MDKQKSQQALKFVKELAQSAVSAADLHNAFFGVAGKLGQLFPTRSEREEFAATPEYREIVRIRADLRRREVSTADSG